MSSSTAPFFYEGTLRGKQIATAGVFGIPAPSSTNDHGIGSRIRDELTGTVYEYVKFSGVIAKNEVMSVLTSDGTIVAQSAASAIGVAARRGVSVADATDGQYGFIAVQGPVTVKITGNATIGLHLAPDVGNAGKVIVATVSNPPTQAEMVLAANIMGFALGSDGAGVISLFLQHCV